MVARRRIVVALAIIGGATAVGVHVTGYVSAQAGPPPGVSAGVSALDRLPPSASVPASVVRFVETVAPARGTDPHAALARIRKLRTDLGRAHADLYAFRSDAGAPCFTLTDQVGICAASARDGNPGLQWTIGGGNGDLPSNLVGIASDDVTSVDLAVDGVSTSVSLRNNAAFAEYPSDARRAEITIHRADGTRNSVRVELAQPVVDDPAIRVLRSLVLQHARDANRQR